MGKMYDEILCKLRPCSKCGQGPDKLELLDSGPIRKVRCPSCGNGVIIGLWDEAVEAWNTKNACPQLTEVCCDAAFHVHTFRCKHAGDEPDEVYIRKAKELGAKRIIFTDHAPFPGNPFGNRMDIEELPEYIATLTRLREKYLGRIDVGIGLEVEYLPSFSDYYHELAEMEGLDWLILGQHMYEYGPGVYSFSDTAEVKDQVEFRGLCEAMIAGMETGIFRVVAHPDRAFRRRKYWDDDMEELARSVIDTALRTGTVLERNASSLRHKHQYWPEFWELLDHMLEENQSRQAFIIRGLDAHSTEELEKEYIIHVLKS